MGKISMDILVYNTSESIRQKQEIAKEKIVNLIIKAKHKEPLLYNYIKQIQEDDNDEKEWITKLNEEFKQTSYTANKILLIRRELCTSIQKELDSFREIANQDQSQAGKQLNINSSPIFAPLYTRLLQLEQFLFHLT
eukprot:gene2307-2846_t